MSSEPPVRSGPDDHGDRRPVQVRVARVDDVVGIVDVASTRGAQPADLGERVARWIADDARAVLVGVAPGPRVVGWAMVSQWAPDDAPHGHVVSALTVDPGWWRLGIGARLLSGLQRWTWERADELWSIVNARNEASLAVHARHGFVEVRRAPGFGGVTFDGGEGLLLRATRPRGADARDDGRLDRMPSDSEPQQPYRVMTVCTGNICRSPMAQVVLAERFRRAGLGDVVVVDSTGISDEEHGNPIDRRAARVLAAHGYAVPRHSARRVRRGEVAERDLVLAMTASHARALRAMEPDAVDRVRMFRSFDPAAPADGPEHRLDVDDPWYGDEAGFEVTLAEVEAAADGVVEHVQAALAARSRA